MCGAGGLLKRCEVRLGVTGCREDGLPATDGLPLTADAPLQHSEMAKSAIFDRWAIQLPRPKAEITFARAEQSGRPRRCR